MQAPEETTPEDWNGTFSQTHPESVMPPIEEMAKDDAEAIHLAALKWKRFNDVMKEHTAQLQTQIAHNNWAGAIFRVSIIILSALVTIISATQIPIMSLSNTNVVTIVGGAITALAGIESYFHFSQRGSELQRQQREVEALRYKLRHQWITTVQMELHEDKRLDAAKKFLDVDQSAYNAILNNYTLKPEKENSAPNSGDPSGH